MRLRTRPRTASTQAAPSAARARQYAMLRAASAGEPSRFPIADPCGGSMMRFLSFMVPTVTGWNTCGNGESAGGVERPATLVKTAR
jgi:hypothetical protein